MFVKKFEAPSLEQALSRVKNEMGPNALILSTQQKKGNLFKKNSVEITAAFDKRPSRASEKESGARDTFDEAMLERIFPHRRAPEPPPEPEVRGSRPSPKEELRTARSRSARLGRSAPAPEATERRSGSVRSIEATTQEGNRPKKSQAEHFEVGLLRLGFLPDSARELSQRLVYDYPARELTDPVFFEKMRAKLVAASLRTLGPEIFRDKTAWTAVGLSGSGKTSCLVKLALSLKGQGLGVSLVSCDKRKVNARAELAAYARLVHTPFHTEKVMDEEFSGVRLFDCPALQSKGSLETLENFCLPRHCFLVLDVGMRFTEMLRVVEKARPLNPVGVVFTRFDDALQHGAVYDLLRMTKLPLVGISLSASFATPFRFFEPLELAHFILNQVTGN